MTYGGATSDMYYPILRTYEPTRMSKNEISCAPAAISGYEKQIGHSIQHGILGLIEHNADVVRGLRNKFHCVHGQVSQSASYLILSADTGDESQRLYGDYAWFVYPNENTVTRLAAGAIWDRKLDTNIPTGAVIQGCIKLSTQQPYPNLDGVLRLKVYAETI